MILVVLAGLCVLSVPLTGGHLGRLADVKLRGLWVPLLALFVQVVITEILPSGSQTVHSALHVGTYVLLVAFLWLNRGIPGLRVIAAGTVSNMAAIVANHGVMPAARTAERLSGLVLPTGFLNSAPVAHPVLLWLGDIIPYPGPLPNVLSVGDIIIYSGLLVLLHRVCRDPAPAHRRSGIVLRPVPALTAVD